MRMMLRWTVPPVKGTETVRNGTLPRTIENLLDTLHPEAAYFMPLDGQRAGMMVFDMADPDQIAQIAEPLFQQLDAAVEFFPVMDAEDLKRGLGKLSS